MVVGRLRFIGRSSKRVAYADDLIMRLAGVSEGEIYHFTSLYEDNDGSESHSIANVHGWLMGRAGVDSKGAIIHEPRWTECKRNSAAVQ